MRWFGVGSAQGRAGCRGGGERCEVGRGGAGIVGVHLGAGTGWGGVGRGVRSLKSAWPTFVGGVERPNRMKGSTRWRWPWWDGSDDGHRDDSDGRDEGGGLAAGAMPSATIVVEGTWWLIQGIWGVGMLVWSRQVTNWRVTSAGGVDAMTATEEGH